MGHLELSREGHRRTASFKKKWKQYPLSALLSNRGACPGWSGPARMAADEAEIWWIRGVGRNVDRCFPGLRKKAWADVLLSVQQGRCRVRAPAQAVGSSNWPRNAGLFWKECLALQKWLLTVSAACEELSSHFKAAIGSSAKVSEWGGEEAKGPRSRLHVWLLPPKPAPGD